VIAMPISNHFPLFGCLNANIRVDKSNWDDSEYFECKINYGRNSIVEKLLLFYREGSSDFEIVKGKRDIDFGSLISDALRSFLQAIATELSYLNFSFTWQVDNWYLFAISKRTIPIHRINGVVPHDFYFVLIYARVLWSLKDEASDNPELKSGDTELIFLGTVVENPDTNVPFYVNIIPIWKRSILGL